ncbi:Hpt domain-containing protein [Ottowia sp.]|uniref:hybrid sensor histidine kinase/response regulator n=1 Tax=Ottowia sp. TaxID=1898956 RepID=UPI00393D67B7
MVTDRLTENAAAAAVPAGDLGPLAWVLDETRKSIQAATKALRRFAHEAEHARGIDLASVDASQLRAARQQLHQVAGALDMVGQTVAAHMVRGMETAAQRFTAQPETCTEAAAATLEKAGFALIEFVESQLGERPRSALGLFPQFRQVQELAGADRIHPADLWSQPWRWAEPQLPPSIQALSYGAAVRNRMDHGVLKIMRHADRHAAAELATVSRGLASGAAAGHPTVFWQLGAGFFEALARALPIDAYVKRTASRVLLQYTTLARGDALISERLAQDLLFFCAQAPAGEAADAPALAAVRSAWGLQGHEPVDYEQPSFGLYDPAVLAQARRRIEAVKENWSALAGGDLARLKPSVDQLGLVVESLERLHPGSEPLTQALRTVAQQILRKGQEPTPEQAMEVATTVLFLEASLAEFRPLDATLVARMRELAGRLEAVCDGRPVEGLQPWMEELYRRVSDRQTLGTVVGELRVTLADAEQRLDQFFRKPTERTALDPVPGLLAQMRGVLNVLGLDQAALAVARMRERVEAMRDDQAPDESRQSEAFEKLGNSLGAMGFLIDTLSYQPALARKLFVYDEARDEFRFLGGRVGGAADRSVVPDVALAHQEPAPAAPSGLAPLDSLLDERSPQQLEQVAAQAALDGRYALAQAAHHAAAVARESDDTALDTALQQLHAVDAAPRPAPVEADPSPTELSSDDDLLDIFLDEAREVTATGSAAVLALQADPDDAEQLTTLRRAFHTLKGSSRMVGLNEFGAAAWALEQLLNAWLAEQKPASNALCGVAGEALTAFSSWVDDIAGRRAGAWSAAPFEAMAGALRLRGERIALAGALAASEPVAAADLHLESAHPAGAETVTVAPGAEPEPPVLLPGVAAESPDPLLAAFDLPDLELSEPIVLNGVAEVAKPVAAESNFIDLTGVQADADAVAAAFEAPTTLSPLAAAEAHEPLDFEFHLEPDAPAPAVPSGLVALDLPDLQLPPATPDEASHQALLETDAPPAVDDVASAPEFAAAPPADPAVTWVGPLRISTPLYNVYLSEADQWSAQLASDLAQWGRHVQAPLPERAVARAHSLAGSSATVGFTALSDLARTLEHALERLQGQPQGTPDQALVLNHAADELRGMLHQFAAGILKDPAPDVVQAVRALEPAEAPANLSGSPADTAPSAMAPTEAAIADTEVREPDPVQEGAAWPAHAMPSTVAPLAPEAAHHASTEGLAQGFADDIDVADAVDPDLFAIFEEEADELLPQLSAALRQWAAQPQDLGARAQALRVLHTLKGSARLAGALRLGEMAHRTESAVEMLGTESITAADVEPLLEHLDRIQADFQALRTSAEANVDQVLVAPPSADASAADASLASAPVHARPDAVPAPERGDVAEPTAFSFAAARASARQTVRVRSQLLDRLMSQAGEVMSSRARLDKDVAQLRAALADLTGNVERLRGQLRDVELQAETQMQSRMAQSKDTAQSFDPLEFDRFTRMQELTRMMAESVNDVATVQRNLQRAIDASEDELVAQARQSRDLQRDLLRTRMVEFDGISERLYRLVRQASKESGKQVRLDIVGGNIEVDRGILERMTPAFEHLLRNCVVHGIEGPDTRRACGKDATGTITIEVQQSGNDVAVQFRDDGAGLDLARIRARAIERGLITPEQSLSDAETRQLVFQPGFTTATEVTDLAGRGVGLDVVRTEVQALGGRIETESAPGQSTAFRLVLPLTTAVTHVVMIRMGDLLIGVPASLVERVHRSRPDELARAYADGAIRFDEEDVPFFWGGALLQHSVRSREPAAKTAPVVLLRSAAQRTAMHVDEVLGGQDVVVKALGPQLSRLPGLVAITALASGVVALIYNPVALATVYGEQVRALQPASPDAPAAAGAATPAVGGALPAQSDIPLVLVVDDSITVRRVTQRLLQREGYRVALAADGLQGLERLQQERPAVVLSDIEMPRMDGFDFLRNIRADAAWRDLPVVMITSRTADKHQEHARQLGANHYLGKPYSEDELLGLVRTYAQAAKAAVAG